MSKIKNLKTELENLTKENVISIEVADRIKNYYEKEEAKAQESLLTSVFTTLGMILSLLAIITLLALNWNSMSTITKSFVAILPTILTIG